MSNYDRQYADDDALFGAAYPEFTAFLAERGRGDGRCALDLGCGQGRDALLLARHGYHVTGVDSSAVGIQQMMARAEADGLLINGVVDDLFAYQPEQQFDAIVLDSILHFEKNDRQKELALLDRVVSWLQPGGMLFLFVHKVAKKERELRQWTASVTDQLEILQKGALDYVYEEKSSGFRSEFQMAYVFLMKR